MLPPDFNIRSFNIDTLDVQARVLYLRIATSCNRALLLPRSENDRDWTRVHGLLLGMRATIEGAAEEASISPHRTASANPSNDNDEDHDTSEGERLVDSPLRRETLTLAVFAKDVLQACEEKGRGGKVLSENNDGAEVPEKSKPCETVENMPCEADKRRNRSQSPADPLVFSSNEPETISGGAMIGPTPQARPLPPLPPRSIPAPSSTELAFSCLSHRQAAVREAAVDLLNTLAYFLGPHPALALYERTLGDLQREKENAESLAMRGRGGACGATAGCGLKAVGVGSRAETRRRCDRVSGLLDLLERIVVVLPPETVGKTWEQMFPLLG